MRNIVLCRAPVKQYGEQLCANDRGQLAAAAAFSWIFLHILCLYFQRSSLHEAPSVDKAAFVESVALQAAVRSPPCFLLPQQVHIKGGPKMRTGVSRAAWGIALKAHFSRSLRTQLKSSRTHLSTVRTWFVYIMHSTLKSGWGAPQTISQFLAVTWLTGALRTDPRKKKKARLLSH